MGQNRTDTPNQREAKQRVADRRQCRACGRRSAMSTRIELRGDRGKRGSLVSVLRGGRRRGLVERIVRRRRGTRPVEVPLTLADRARIAQDALDALRRKDQR